MPILNQKLTLKDAFVIKNFNKVSIVQSLALLHRSCFINVLHSLQFISSQKQTKLNNCHYPKTTITIIVKVLTLLVQPFSFHFFYRLFVFVRLYILLINPLYKLCYSICEIPFWSKAKYFFCKSDVGIIIAYIT